MFLSFFQQNPALKFWGGSSWIMHKEWWACCIDSCIFLHWICVILKVSFKWTSQFYDVIQRFSKIAMSGHWRYISALGSFGRLLLNHALVLSKPFILAKILKSSDINVIRLFIIVLIIELWRHSQLLHSYWIDEVVFFSYCRVSSSVNAFVSISVGLYHSINCM